MLVWGYIADLSMVPRLRRGRLAGRALRAPFISCAVKIGPPQAAWRGAGEHPSGGPSAPGRRCWRLGRKRPSPFSNSGPTAPLRSDPNLEGLKSLRCGCAKGWGAAAAPQARPGKPQAGAHRWQRRMNGGTSSGGRPYRLAPRTGPSTLHVRIM